MGLVTSMIEKMKTAVYGEDVREAIYRSTEILENEVESISSKQNTLQTIYSNQIKNMSQQNPSAAEVVDARTNDTGVSYSTLGERLTSERADGGTNLLRSTELDINDDLTLWKLSNYISIDSNILTPNGNRTFHFYVEDNTANFAVGQQVKLISSTTYTFSAWVLLSEGAADNENINFQISYIKPDGTTIWRNENINTSMLNKGNWTLISKSFALGTIKEGTLASVSVQCYRNKWHGYIGNIKLELGKHSTDRSPNPKDLVYRASKYADSTIAIAKTELNEKYIFKGWVAQDFPFINNTFYPKFTKNKTCINFDWDTEHSGCKVKADGYYDLKVSLEIYYPGTSGKQSCEGDLDILINGISKDTYNYGIVLHNGRACCIHYTTILELHKGDLIEIAVSNNSPDSSTYDFRAEHSWISLNKI